MALCRCGQPARYSAQLSPLPAVPVLALVKGVLCYRCAVTLCEGATRPEQKPGEQLRLM